MNEMANCRNSGGLRLAALLSLVVLTGLAFVACVTPESKVCADGLICPPNSQCDDVNHRCLGPSYCGDGARSASEKCEGRDLDGQTCESLGYYDETTGLACSDSCMFDTSGCMGRCGDGQIDAAREQCDGAPPAGKSCLDYGYDRGFLQCTERCEVSTEDCESLSWPAVLSSDGNRFWGVWGSGPNDIFAVGESPVGAGIVFHWDGLQWSQMTIPASSSLRQIEGRAANDVWALSADQLLHWDGAVWSTTIDTQSPEGQAFSGETLESFAVGSAGDVYIVVGASAPYAQTIFHWDGCDWGGQPFAPLPAEPRVWPIGSAGPAAPGVCGSAGPAFLPGEVHSNIYVTPATVPGPVSEWMYSNRCSDSAYSGSDGEFYSCWVATLDDQRETFTSLWGRDNDVYALSDQRLYHWDGALWTQVPDAPGGNLIRGTTDDDIFIVSKTRVGENENGSTVTHWDGLSWSVIYQGDEVDDLWASGLDHLYVAGPAGVSRWARAPVWTLVAESYASSMWGTNEDVYLRLPHEEGSPDSFAHASKERPLEILSDMPPGGNPRGGLWGTSSHDIWALGDQSHGVLHWDGSSWTDAGFESGPYLMGLSGSGANDVWVVGDVTSHWDGRAWSQPVPSQGLLSAVWAQSPDNAFAVGVGTGGLPIMHWDGNTWSEMVTDIGGDLLNDVWGTGANDVYVLGGLGDGGGKNVLHFDGDQWKPMESSSSGLLEQAPSFGSSIRASGPGNVFVAGGTSALHLRAGAWEPIAFPLGQVGAQRLWVTPTSAYVSFAFSGRIYRLDLPGVDCQSPETNCTDGWDNDCDGVQDGADADCKGRATPERCANLADDDYDGLTDCDDPDCTAFPNCRD